MPEKVLQLTEHARKEFAKVIIGQNDVVDQVLVTILCGGHALLEGVPGIAKTLVAKLLARVFQLEFKRIQCTPDLMPADVIGANIFNLSTSKFKLHPGPVFSDILLVDEINRTPPRTQSALLEAMEEYQVTIDGKTHVLPETFTVLATQNPIEFEGTYPLPEAQLDRFLLKISIVYPEQEQENQILQAHHEGFHPRELDKVDILMLKPAALEEARTQVAAIRVEPALISYITDITRSTRTWPSVSLGVSPRGAINLLSASKARAAMDGRDYIIPDDVKAMALPVLRHRILLRPEADLEGLSPDHILSEIGAAIEVPK